MTPTSMSMFQSFTSCLSSDPRVDQRFLTQGRTLRGGVPCVGGACPVKTFEQSGGQSSLGRWACRPNCGRKLRSIPGGVLSWKRLLSQPLIGTETLKLDSRLSRLSPLTVLILCVGGGHEKEFCGGAFALHVGGVRFQVPSWQCQRGLGRETTTLGLTL